MKTLLRTAALLALLATLNSPLFTGFAQGTAFTYQGRLNSNGTNTTGSYDVKFTLFATNTTGAVIAGPVTNSATGVSNGLFTVVINFGNVFTGASNWLELAVRSNGVATFTTLTPRQQLTPVPYAIYATTASNLSGTVTAAQLPAGVVTNNATGLSLAGSFSGNGTSVTNVNAVTLGGLSSAGFWKTNGNAGANSTNGAFLGTTDNLPLEFKVNGVRALRLEPNATSANVIGGFSGNFISNGVVGGFVVGGGFGATPNRVGGNYSSVLGGNGNVASGPFSTAAGQFATASGNTSTAIGNVVNANGQFSTALGDFATASGLTSFAAGSSVTASGIYSTAMGRLAQASHNSTFVWSDDSGAAFSSTTNNQFLIRATGGVGINTNNPGTNALLVNGTVAANNFSGTFSGNGAGITNVSLGALQSSGVFTWPGIFGSIANSTTSVNHVSLTVADWNSDGKPDFACSIASVSGLLIVTNSGQEFGQVTVATLPAGVAVSVASADVNGDGRPDLIAATTFGANLMVLTNSGNLTFPLASSPALPGTPVFVLSADVNGDGKPDLISAFGSGSITLLTNNGSGAFTTASSPSVNGSASWIVAGDFNGDGKVDLACPNSSFSSQTILTNNGSGGFAQVSSGLFAPFALNRLAAADVNGDGKLDLIGGTVGASLVFTNDGGGRFTYNGGPSLPSVGGTATITPADVNGDGKMDLISASSITNKLLVLVNDGTGANFTATTYGLAHNPNMAAATDVNGDGRVDLISANAGSLSFLLNTPSIIGVFSGDGSGLTALNAANLSGAIANGNLPPSPTFSGAVMASTFSGNGNGLTALNAANLTGAVPASALTNVWFLNGNTGANPTNGAFLGTTDNLPLELRANGLRALRLQQGSFAPSVVGGSRSNMIDGNISAAVIAGGGSDGEPNIITNAATYAFIGAGKLNSIGGAGSGGVASVIAGGDRNSISGQIAVIGGGQFNSAAATYSVIPGGQNNAVGASGTYSLAAGQRAKANHQGTFVWSDSQAADFASTANNQFLIRAAGGVGIGTNNPQAALHVAGTIVADTAIGINTTTPLYPLDVNGSVHIGTYAADGTPKLIRFGDNSFVSIGENTTDDQMELTATRFSFITGNVSIGATTFTNKLQVVNAYCNGSTWVNASDRNLKQNFAGVDAAAVLAKIVALPIQSWSYKTQPGEKHIGPVAQDFHAAFGLGQNNTSITTVDEGGVALAAIQGLNQKVEREASHRQKLESENAELKQQLAELKALVQTLVEKR